MKNKSPSLVNVIAALPAVQAAIRDEIAARIAAGDAIASDDSPEVRRLLAQRRKALDAGRSGQSIEGRRSAA